MCLIILKNYSQNKQTKRIIAWKVVHRHNLSSPVIGNYGFLHPNKKRLIYKKGLVISDRGTKKITRNEKKIGRVGKGIHVWTTRERARLCVRYSTKEFYTIIKLEVDPEDLVAANTYQAVYMKVKVPT